MAADDDRPQDPDVRGAAAAGGGPPEGDAELEVPRAIGPYKVLRALARGGMAAVYEVVDYDTGNRYALKLLTQRGLARPRFDREYRALTRLDHDNIVRVYRFGSDEDGRPYLTMELLDGVAAQVHAKSCGRPGTPRRTAEVVRIVTHVADALDYLHQRGIVHRDLKSSNVMVLPDGRVKLLDFGTARLRSAAEEITRKGEFVGTFAYASPEQLQGNEVDARADIYSLGVLFYRLLTGKRPFEADSPHALALMHIEQEPRSPAELAKGLPQPLVDLVLQMLAKAPELRPQSTREVADRLRDFAAGGRQDTRPTGPLPPMLVGREDTLAALRSAIDKGRPGRMVMLVGPPGAGRRRLLEQCALDAHRKGRRVFRGDFPGSSALGPIGDMVRRAVRGLPPLPEGDTEADRIADLPRGTLPAPAAQVRIFQAVSSALMRRAAADRRGVVICLSDLHRAPPLALQALRVLRSHAEERDVSLVILSSSIGGADRPGSLLRRQFPDAIRIELQPLTPAEVGRLVGSMLGRKPPPPELARRIHDATGGLPGYVEEVVRAMVQEGLVEGRPAGADSVAWVDRSAGRIAIPSSAREAVSLRLAALDGVARRLVGALAVAGGAASSDLLVHGADLPDDAAHTRLEELEADGLLSRDGDTWRFRLGLTAELVEEGLRPARRLVHERRLAAHLVDANPSPVKVRLMLAAGDVQQALIDAVAWARPELSRPQHGDVIPVLDAVAQAIPGQRDLPASVLGRYYLCMARALAGQDPADARIDGYLSRAGALASGWARKTEVHLEHAAIDRLRGDSRAERASVARAEALLDHVPDPLLRLRVQLGVGRRATADGDYDRAIRAFRDAQRAAEQGGDLSGAGEARARSGIARFAMGELEAAERTLQGAAAAFDRLDDLQGRWLCRLHLCDVLAVQGRFSEALALVLPELDRARSTAPPALYAAALTRASNALIDLFRLGEARELLAELAAIDPAVQAPPERAARAMAQARLLVEGREPLAALNVIDPARQDATRYELPVDSALLLAWGGVAAAAAGDAHQGDDMTRRALTILQRERDLPALATACACRARVAPSAEDPDQIFMPVLRWMEAQPARVHRMHWLLARIDHAIDRGDKHQVAVQLDRADRLLADIKTRLSDADASALKVHPWQRRLDARRAALDGG